MVDQYGRWYPDYPGQQPYQDPAYMRAVGQPVQQQNMAHQQDMTPTIRTEIKQIDNIESIKRNPPAPGTTGAYMTKDEKIIVFRTMYANGEYNDKIYDERPPAPPEPKFDPTEYVRRDEISGLVDGILSDRIAAARRRSTTEGNDGTV